MLRFKWQGRQHPSRKCECWHIPAILDLPAEIYKHRAEISMPPFERRHQHRKLHSSLTGKRSHKHIQHKFMPSVTYMHSCPPHTHTHTSQVSGSRDLGLKSLRLTQSGIELGTGLGEILNRREEVALVAVLGVQRLIYGLFENRLFAYTRNIPSKKPSSPNDEQQLFAQR